MMMCPLCQIPLTVTNRFSVEVHGCPQCHGMWLEQNGLEKMIQQLELVESPEKSQKNNKTIEVQNSQNKKRGSRQFISGALDIYDDW